MEDEKLAEIRGQESGGNKVGKTESAEEDCVMTDLERMGGEWRALTDRSWRLDRERNERKMRRG